VADSYVDLHKNTILLSMFANGIKDLKLVVRLQLLKYNFEFKHSLSKCFDFTF